MQDKAFEKSRERLESKRKHLRQSGKGGQPNKALGLNSDKLEKFWSEKQLGDHLLDALLCTIWINNMTHFGWRARDERRKVLLRDLEIRQEEDEEKREYIIWKTEGGSKTRTGGKKFGAERYFSPQVYLTGGELCPVKLFKIFLAHRLPDIMKPEDPLYLVTVKKSKGQVWYKRQSLSVHSLGQFMKTMAVAINLNGKHTNHSAQRTMIIALHHENMSPLDMSQLSGHKNLKSIDSYSTVSEQQQKDMSLQISSHCRASRPPLKQLNQLSLNCFSGSTTSGNGTHLFSGAVFNN